MEFWVNPEIDLTKIKDSMQLDSNQDIATLKDGKYYVSLETRGSVCVFFDGVCYDAPSVFPEELKNIIANKADWFTDPRIEVVGNNWFEVFYGTDQYPYESYDTIDAEGLDYIGLLELLLECVTEMQNEEIKS